jgi:hypothetical protein
VARDWGQDQKNNLDWWEGYCAKMTWAEVGWATFFGSCPLVHFGKALHSWSHLKKRCLAQLLHEPEPKLKNKPYQRALTLLLFWNRQYMGVDACTFLYITPTIIGIWLLIYRVSISLPRANLLTLLFKVRLVLNRQYMGVDASTFLYITHP